MDSRRFDLESDLEEIDRLLSLATRSSVKEFLITHRLQLAQDLKSLPIAASPQPVLPSEPILWKPINNFAWDQTDSEVKIYVTSLGDLKSHPKEKIIIQNTEDSVEVSIRDFLNSNYKLKFSKLNKEIVSARVTAKSNGFSLALKKKGKGNWDALVPKKSPIGKADETKEEGKDPGDGLMNMMKELYENGDDMKRTIAEAWTKSKDKENPSSNT